MLRHLRDTGFALIVGLIAVLALVLPVYADDPPGIIATVNIVGTNPDAHVNMYGDNPDVWINGAGLDQLSAYFGAQAGAAAGAAAASSSAANSVYSGVGTGMLPLPTITSDGKVASIDSPGTQWVPGWQGFFCPKTNLDPMVYHGSGCGGTWGVCDGWPDMWARRQIAGLAPEFRQTQNRLDVSYVALSKLIVATQDQDSNIVNINQALQDHLAQLSILSADVAILEKEHQALKVAVLQQKEESDRKTLILSIIFGSGLLGMAGYLAVTTQHYRPRKVAVEQKGLFGRLAAKTLHYWPRKTFGEQKGMFSRLAAKTLHYWPRKAAGEQKGVFSRLASKTLHYWPRKAACEQKGMFSRLAA